MKINYRESFKKIKLNGQEHVLLQIKEIKLLEL